MTRALALALALLLSSAGISGARLLRGGVGGGGSPTTISAISPSSLSFTTPVSGGAATGITLGLTMTSGSGNGATFALATHSGCPSTDNASFAVPGTALPASVPINAGGSTVNANSYVICLEAILAGATNSPFFQSFTITGTGQTIASIAPASYNYTTGASSGTVVGPFSVTMSPPSPAFSGTLSLSTTAGGCNSTNGANNGSFAFSGINLQLATTGPSGAQAVCALASQAGLTSVGQAVTVTGTSGGVAVGTRTVKNFAASTTPSGSAQTCLSAGDTCFPAELFKAFSEGQVPTGQIAVPAVGATAIRYQAEDCAEAWPDGSLRGCRFIMFLPPLAAGASEQITWTTQTGSYDHTSSGAISDITSATDYKEVITNESQVINATYPNPMPPFTNLIFTVSGGVVTGASVKNTSNQWGGCNTTGSGSCSPFSITMTGCAVEPNVQVSFDSTSHQVNGATIVSGGSGCVVDGSGSYQLSFNLLSGGSNVVQYEKGQLVDAWDAYGAMTDVSGGAAHPWLSGHVMVEHFKNADGSTYGFRAVALGPLNNYWGQSAAMPGFQYDFCWQNGSTALHGYGGVCGTSNPTFQAVHQVLQSGMVSIIPDNTYGGPAGRPDWSVNSAALNSVQIVATAADELDMRASGYMPPFDTSAAARATVPTTPITVTNTWSQCAQGMLGPDEGNYFPFLLNMTDCNASWGQGGGHPFLGPLPQNAMIWLVGGPNMTDGGASYLQQIRLSAAGQLGGDGAGAVEPATGHAINIVSTSTFPSLTPLRSDGSSRAGVGVACSGPGSQISSETGGSVCDIADYGHWPSYYNLPYFLEGERWVLDALDMGASQAFSAGCCGQQDVVINGTAYRGLLANTTNDGIRDFIEAEWQLENAAVFLPTSNPDQPYYEWLMNNNWSYVDAYMAFTGTGCYGGTPGQVSPCTGDSFTKDFNDTALGVYTDQRSRVGGDMDPQWMYEYGMWDLLQRSKQFAHKYTAIDDLVQYWVQNFGTKITTQCPYNAIPGYIMIWFSNWQTLQNVTGWDATTPGLDETFASTALASTNISTISGSPVLTSTVGGTDYPVSSGTPLAVGSQVVPTNINNGTESVPNDSNVGTWPPPPWLETHFYYYYPLDLTHGVTSTDNTGTTFTGQISANILTSTTSITTTSGEAIGGMGVAGGTTIVTGGTGTTFTTSGAPQTVSSETMVADAGMITATGNTTSMWGEVANAACPSGYGFAGSISGTTLTIPAGATLSAGWTLTGRNGDITSGTTIVSGSGTSYQVSHSQTVSSEKMFAFSGNNGNWNDPGGDNAPDGRFNEALSVAIWAEAVLGPYSDADTTITNLKGVTNYPTNMTTPWLLQPSF